MPRKPLIAANWKMHKTSAEVRSFMSAVWPKVSDITDREMLICPPFPYIPLVDELRKSTSILLGAQNLYFEEKGAFTGEVSPPMLKDLGCEYVIIGHSERRGIFGESDELINSKMHAVIKCGIIPVLCVGERKEEREKNLTEQIILKQLEKNLKDLPETAFEKMVIAYEPIWAIGTGLNASTKDAHDAIALIREFIHSKYGDNSAQKTRILYGGSVKPENMKSYMDQEGIDGALVGGASLDPDSYSKLVKY
ncbi:MAG: triose-phosphate isomerase [Candidatus Riflebacteria bacterium]|nr:triose-phosphate isomerase [Candidatus Riflebacteria bacterium]